MKNNLLFVSSLLHSLVRQIDCLPAESSLFISRVFHTSPDLLVDFQDQLFSQAILNLSEVFSLAKDDPAIFTINEDFAYALMQSTCSSSFILIGPVRFSTRVYSRFTYTSNDLQVSMDPPSYQDWLHTVPICDYPLFAKCLTLLALGETDTSMDDFNRYQQELTEKNCVNLDLSDRIGATLTKNMFQNLENQIVHNPFGHEIREVTAIEQGNLAALNHVISENFTGRYGKLAETPLRQEINIGIVTITLASRAAIRAGLHFEIAFYMSDIAIQSMEKCLDVETVTHIYRSTERAYCERVRELKSSSPGMNPAEENPHISRCKDYIYTHLHGKITVADVAMTIGLEANYLSHLFRREEGISMKTYIANAKIELVKNLLVYSQTPYVKISSYLGFSSQSHMSRLFRAHTGMTPGQYRNRYQKEDFIQEDLDG